MNTIDQKIVAGLERLSQVFKALLWEQAKKQRLSPIQIQLLLFMHDHRAEMNSISYLAREFNVTKPTISDAIKVLEQKGLIRKIADSFDSRRYSMELTAAGGKVVAETQSFTSPVMDWVEQVRPAEKEMLWGAITDLIRQLNRKGIIQVQRSCFNCRFYEDAYGRSHDIAFCNLLQEPLLSKDIRIDCPEFEEA